MSKEEVDIYVQSLSSPKSLKRREIKQLYKNLLLGVTMLRNYSDECESLSKHLKSPIQYIYDYKLRR